MAATLKVQRSRDAEMKAMKANIGSVSETVYDSVPISCQRMNDSLSAKKRRIKRRKK